MVIQNKRSYTKISSSYRMFFFFLEVLGTIVIINLQYVRNTHPDKSEFPFQRFTTFVLEVIEKIFIEIQELLDQHTDKIVDLL